MHLLNEISEPGSIDLGKQGDATSCRASALKENKGVPRGIAFRVTKRKRKKKSINKQTEGAGALARCQARKLPPTCRAEPPPPPDDIPCRARDLRRLVVRSVHSGRSVFVFLLLLGFPGRGFEGFGGAFCYLHCF